MSDTILTALNTAFQSVQTNAMSGIEAALPIALAITGTVMAVNITIKTFKKISGK